MFKRFLTPLLLLSLSACAAVPQPISPTSALPDFQTFQAEAQTSYFSTAILDIPESVAIDQAYQTLQTLANQTRQEAGNLSFVVQTVATQPRQIVIWEQFINQAAFESHLQTPHVKVFFASQHLQFVKGFSATRTQVKLSPETGGYFSTAILRLQNPKQPHQLEAARSALTRLSKATTKELGNQNFVVQESTQGSDTYFIIWEQFTTKAAFEAHLQTPHVQAFLKANLLTFEQGLPSKPLENEGI